ncbi:hypothetical protein [Streptomyces aurantiogriseus]|uniref:Uncharacterized protein n=1 Tax=Streptomyces aurantiogriseus TaxID=66870 RepID=A0A918FBY6_9ACTN|nr:hypothetical protein [Streptomyces aurantiogriseus]GGR28902.1 hypothetical protein GCM10010251_51390 [Streptomyces aurantiogriseus]
MNKLVVVAEAVAGLALLAVTATGALAVAAAVVAVLVGTGLLADALQRVRSARRSQQD